MEVRTQFARDICYRTVGDLVAEEYRRAPIFKKYDIDFCCGGNKTLKQACDDRGISCAEIASALGAANAPMRTRSEDMRTWPPDFLADYIERVHHSYVRENLPLLSEFTQLVASAHGQDHPEVIKIAEIFEEVAAELEEHMESEEGDLFPYVRSLSLAQKGGSSPKTPIGGSISDSIEALLAEHEHAGALMHEIRRLSGDFAPPKDACSTYRTSYAKLEEFEDDLHRHVHLENNILFPKAAALEMDL